MLIMEQDVLRSLQERELMALDGTLHIYIGSEVGRASCGKLTSAPKNPRVPLACDDVTTYLVRGVEGFGIGLRKKITEIGSSISQQ